MLGQLHVLRIISVKLGQRQTVRVQDVTVLRREVKIDTSGQSILLSDSGN